MGIPWLANYKAFLLALIVWSVCSLGSVNAKDLHAISKVLHNQSGIVETDDGAIISLGLTKEIPFRVFTLNNPDRLVLDFRDIDWRGTKKEQFLADELVSDLRFGLFQPGWSRMVIDLAKPLLVESAELNTTGPNSVLRVKIARSDRAEFDANSGQASNQSWMHQIRKGIQSPKTGLRIAIDPGHGGVDPGAVREGIMEKDIALKFSLELAEVISEQTDFEVVLTRNSDMSVSLSERVEFARRSDADIFLSVHSNTVTRGDASGASVYTLSERASDAASARLAELENRADISVGLNSQVEGDDVARILVDLAQADTNSRSKIFAGKLIEMLHESVGVLRSKPHRSAGFKVLKAHDIPSVLLELGFMSNAQDRQNMQNKNWRREAANAVVEAINGWVAEDEERAKLVLK